MFKLALLTALLLLILVIIKKSATSMNTHKQQEIPKNVVQRNQQLKLDVYYETLCPDSLDFLVNQLNKLYYDKTDFQFWNSLVRVELIPYGKAETQKVGISSYRFYCQHGSRECEGNRLHSCAIKYLPNYELTLHFVVCTMKIMNGEQSLISTYNLLSCTSQNTVLNRLVYRKIFDCYKSRESGELLMQNGKKTHALHPQLTFVPWIVINDFFRNDVQQRSLVDLKSVLCSYLLAMRRSHSDFKGLDEKCAAYVRGRRNTRDHFQQNYETLRNTSNNYANRDIRYRMSPQNITLEATHKNIKNR